MTDEVIYNSFSNIYELKLMRSHLNGKDYLMEEHKRGDDADYMNAFHMEVSDEDEQLEMLF